MDSTPAFSTGTPLTLRTAGLATGLSLLYLALSSWVLGYRNDELILVLLFNTLFYLSGSTRRFIRMMRKSSSFLVR